MRRLIQLLLIFTLFIIVISPVHAQTNSRVRNPKLTIVEKQLEREELMEQKREELTERLRLIKASQEARLSQVRVKVLNAYWNNLEKRLLASISRLETLVSRLESRIAKLKTEDPEFDNSQVDASISEAKTKLANAKVKLDAAGVIFEETLDSESPKDAFVVVRKTVAEIKADLKEVHQLLVHIIGDLRGVRTGQVELTTTPKVTAIPTVSLTATPTE